MSTRSDIIAVLPSMVGAAFVALGLPLYANLCWIVGNPILIVKNYKQKDTGQMIYFAVCSVIAAYGIYNLS